MWNVVDKSSAYSASNNDFVMATAGTSGFAITSPTASNGSTFGVMKVDNGVGTITVQGLSLVVEGDHAVFLCDGTTWRQIDGPVPSAPFETATRYSRLDQMATAANPVDFGSEALTSLAAGTNSTDAANLSQTQAWILDSNSWTRSTNTTFTISGNVTATYGPGVAVKWAESGVQKYGVVTSSSYSAGTTTVTIASTSDYAMAANPDASSNYYSFGVPRDFPDAFTWSGIALTGFASSPTVDVANFTLKPGRRIFVCFYFAGTSNATTMTATLPIAANALSQGQVATGFVGIDNNSYCQALCFTTASSTTLTFNKATSILSVAWTSSNTKGGVGTIEYGV